MAFKLYLLGFFGYLMVSMIEFRGVIRMDGTIKIMVSRMDF